MKLWQKIAVAVAILTVGVLVYSPHFSYHFPFHVDEWHHISEAIRLGSYGEYFDVLRTEWQQRFGGMEMGFHFSLFVLSFFTDLVLSYQYLPALWAMLSAAIIFYTTYKKTGNNFLIGLLAVIFFGSIKSNVNLTGLWFFTPLTFAIPLIFLYLYLFTEGVEQNNRKFVLLSLALMLALVPTHSISVLFAIPMLLMYSLINIKFFIREYKLTLLFLTVPIIGVLFYKAVIQVPWSEMLRHLFDQLQFNFGWGVLEIPNKFTDAYSPVALTLAALGVLYILIWHPKSIRPYLLYLLWPITTAVSVFIFRLTGVAYLSPAQRTLYYFTLSLPFFSALGVYGLLDLGRRYLLTGPFNQRLPKIVESLCAGLIIAIAVVLIFIPYYQIPKQVDLYRVIDDGDYQALLWLKDQPQSTVMATPFVSTALYPITGHTPVGTVAFYGNRDDVIAFLASPTCQQRAEILQKHHVTYVVSPVTLSCDWSLVYEKEKFIYQAGR